MKEKIVKSGKFIWSHKVIFGGAAVLAMGALYFGYNNDSADKQVGEVQTATVKRGNIEILVTGSGQVHSNSQVDLQGVAAGDGIDVVQVEVKNDQEVKKGDLIAVLDTTEPMKDVRNAQLGLQSALISLKQTEKQYNTKTIEDKWQRQSQEISVQQRRNSLAEANEGLEDYYIRAPFDGIVTGLSVEAGDSISRDDIIASIITKEMYAEISLNEVDAAKVKEGNGVKLTFDAIPGLTMDGKIATIDTIGQVSQNVVSYNAKIEFDSTSDLLKPGMSVNAEIAVESKQDVVQVSNSAIKTDDDGNSYVQMLSETSRRDQENSGQGIRIVNQPVGLGITDDVVTEVTSGLDEGDIIITKVGSGSTSTSQDESRGLFGSFRFPGAGAGGRGR